MVATSSFPIFDYLQIDKKNDSLGSLKNVREFDEPVLAQIDTTIHEGMITTNGKMVKGYTKVKKKVVLQKQVTYTAAKFIFYYNAKGQRINIFMDSDGSEFSGNTFFTYDEKGRMKEILFYYINSYKLKNGIKKDSIYKWRDFFRGDSTSATAQTQKQIKKELADTLARYSAIFEYNLDGSTTETAVFANKTYKLIYYRNQKGQIVKSIFSRLFIQNQFMNGRFIPTDTKLLADSAFSLDENTSVYQYDTSNRIIKKTSSSFYENKKEKKFEDYCIFKYNDNRSLILPESEYVDFINEGDYWSQQVWLYYH